MWGGTCVGFWSIMLTLPVVTESHYHKQLISIFASGNRPDLNCHEKAKLLTAACFPFSIHTAHLENKKTGPSTASGDPPLLDTLFRGSFFCRHCNMSQGFRPSSPLQEKYFYNTYYIYLCIYVSVCVWIYMIHMSPGAQGGQKEYQIPKSWIFWWFKSSYVGAENWTPSSATEPSI